MTTVGSESVRARCSHAGPRTECDRGGSNAAHGRTQPVQGSAAHLSGGQHRAAPSTRLPAGHHDAVRVSVTVSAARIDAVRAGARLLSPRTDADRWGARLLSSGTEPARWGSQLFFTFLLRAAEGTRLKSGFLGLSEPRSRHLARVLILVSAGSRWPPPAVTWRRLGRTARWLGRRTLTGPCEFFTETKRRSPESPGPSRLGRPRRTPALVAVASATHSGAPAIDVWPTTSVNHLIRTTALFQEFAPTLRRKKYAPGLV